MLAERTECLGLPMLVGPSRVISACCAERLSRNVIQEGSMAIRSWRGGGERKLVLDKCGPSAYGLLVVMVLNFLPV